MKHRKRFFSIAVCLFFIMTIVPSFASQSLNRKKTVRVGLALSVGYHTLNADKTVSGFGYTYEQTLAQFANWNIEYVQGNWTELQEMLENGEIDILGFLVKTKERENLYNFAKKSTGISMSCLLTEKNNFSLSYKDYEKFNGITIAYQSSNANIKTFTNYAKENSFTFKALECESYTDVYNALDQRVVPQRSLTALSATNLLLYEIISYKYSHFFYSSLMKIFVFFRSNASIFKFTFSAAYSRILPLHCIALKLNILSESKLDLFSEIFLFYNQFFAQALRFNSFFNRA